MSGAPNDPSESATARGRAFVGRERELAELQAALADALAGRGRLVLLVGEPGIGKTRLADELGTHARHRGASVFWGRCWEGGGAPAYWPWIQVLRALLRVCEPADVSAADAVQLARVLPELQPPVALASAAATTPIVPEAQEEARFPLYDALARLLGRRAGQRPLVLILDDLHAADAESLLLLQFVARELPTAPILLLGTYRPVEIERDAERAAVLNRVAREGHRLTLAGLTAADVARFIEDACGTPPSAEVVANVHRVTDGNPFFLDEVVRTLVSAGGGRLPADLRSAVPQIPHGIREAVHERLRPLSERCRSVLACAAVIGREFEFGWLQSVTRLAPMDLLDALAEAVAQAVIGALSGAPARYGFSHALIRETLYEECPPSDRLRLHARIGEAMERLSEDERAGRLSELAHHFLQAAPAGAVEKAVQYARRAGDHAMRQLAYEEAVAQYAHALQAAALRRPADLGDELALLLSLGDAQARSWDTASAPATFQRAAELAQQLGDAEAFARAVLGIGGVGLGLPRGGVVNHQLVRRFEEALAGLPAGDAPLRVRLLARIAVELYFSDAVARRRALSREALEIAQRLGDPGALAYALTARHFALWDSPDVAERLATANQSLALAERAGDRDLAGHAHAWRLLDSVEMGDGPGWERELDAVERIAQELRQPRARFTVAILRGMRALWVGRFDEVETIGQEILAIGARIAEPTALGTVTLQRGVVLRARGQYDVLEPIARAGVDRFPNLPIARAMLGVVYADLNREVDARVEFEQLAANDFRDLQRINALDPLLPWLAEVCAFLGDARRAEQLIGQLERYATRVIPFGPRVCFGPATYPLGLLAARFGRAADAVRYFEQAIECCAQMGGRPALATAQYALARVKCDRAGSRDLDEADALVRRALGLAQPLGMAALADKIARLQTEIAEARTAPHDEPSRARAVGDIARPAGGLPPKHEPDVPPEARGQRPRAGGRIVPFPSRRARHAGTAVPTSTAAPAANAGLLAAQRIFRRDGDYWTVGDAQGVLRFTDTKGFRYIAHLLRHPGRAFHVSELVAAEALAPTSPAAASVTLRDRIDDLRDQLDEALRFNDPERAGRLREQLDRVAQDFVAAGGRSKAEIERMRLNVTRAIKAVLKRLGRGNPSLGRDLATTIRTGTYCVYVPDPRLSLTWQLEAES